MEDFGTDFTRIERAMKRSCERQPIIYECGFVDFEDGSALVVFAERIWEMGQYTSAISSMAVRGRLGAHFKLSAKRLDFEWLMIDASHCKVHPHATGAIGGNEGMGHTKGGHEKFIWP